LNDLTSSTLRALLASTSMNLKSMFWVLSFLASSLTLSAFPSLISLALSQRRIQLLRSVL